MASRPTSHQLEALVEFLERNPGIARGLLRTQQAKAETKRKWQDFATAANALGGVIKDGPAWAKYWAEKKSTLKRLCQQQAQSMRRTGGGVDVLPKLSALEQRLVAVMGGQSFALGGRGLAVDPFPHSSSQPSPSVLPPPPSTQSTATEGEVLNFALVPETEEQVRNPPTSPEEAQQVRVEDSEQQTEPRPMQSANRRSQPVRQSRRSRRVSFLDTQLRRFEDIESGRVEAEMQTAQALTRLAAAVEQIAGVLTGLFSVLERLINRQ